MKDRATMDRCSVDALVKRLQGIKKTVTPEERQLLGITEEDIASFANPELLHTPQEMRSAVRDVVEEAYKNVPAFKQMVDEDRARDPQRLPRASKVVSKFLRHLSGIMSPEHSAWLTGDLFKQAHDLILSVAQQATSATAPTTAPELKKVEPLSESELQTFGMNSGQVNALTRQSDVNRAIAYFLGKLTEVKDGKKRRVKNEATKKMPAQIKKDYVYRLLRTIRDAKMTAHGGKLQPFEAQWLGKDETQLQKIVDRLVEPLPEREERGRGSDIYEVMTAATHVLTLTQRALELLGGAEGSKQTAVRMKELTDAIDTALPSAALIEDKIETIQQETSRLKLTKPEIQLLLNVDTEAIIYDPQTGTQAVSNLKEEHGRLVDQRKTTGDTPDISDKIKNVTRRAKALQTLSAKDTSALQDAAREYTELLKEYKDRARTGLSGRSREELTDYETLVGTIDELSRSFNNLAREERFQLKWNRPGGMLFREQEQTLEQPKEAATISSYAKKLEKFRGGGPAKALETLQDFVSDDGLEQLRNKILSIMEAVPENKLNTTGKNFKGNPLAGKGLSVEEVAKDLAKMRTVVKKLTLQGLFGEVSEILSWAAQLPMFVRSRFVKEAFVEDDNSTTSPEKKPGGRGQQETRIGPSQAGWIIHRERLTKLGPQMLKSFFAEPTFVQDFVEQMEKEGLQTMLVKGGEVEAVDVDPVITKIIQKGSGIKGEASFDNILMSKAMRKFRTEFDIEKSQKELGEARDSVQSLNKKIVETEKRFLPQLNRFAEFLSAPLKKVREQLKRRKEEGVPAPEPTKPVAPGVPGAEVQPQRVTTRNVSQLLYNLSGQYGISTKPTREQTRARTQILENQGKAKKARETKRAAEFTMPSMMLKKMLVEQKSLKDIGDNVARIEDPYRRAQQLQELYEMALKQHTRNKAYIESAVSKLEADRQTVQNAATLLESGQANELKPEALTQAKGFLAKLQPTVEKEEQQLEDVRRAVEKNDGPAKMYRERLDKVKEDLADGKVERLYEVALAPEMQPSKGEAQIQKERQRTRERDIGEMMDQTTFKRRMTELLVHKQRSPSLKPAPGEPKTMKLPEGRLKEYQDSLAKMRKREEELNRITDIKNRLFQVKHLYDNIIKYAEGMGGKVEELKANMRDLDIAIQGKKFIEQKREELSEEEAKRYNVLIQSILDALGLEEKENLEATLQKQKDALLDYEEKAKDFEGKIPQFKKKVETFEQHLVTTPRTEAPATNPVAKTAAEPGDKPESPYEIALKTKGKMPEYRKELPQIKGWETLEDFFEESRKELRVLEQVKMTGREWDEVPEEVRKDIADRIKKLEQLIPAINDYKKQIVQIGEEGTPLVGIAERFEQMVYDYQQEIRKVTAQRDAATERMKKLHQSLRGYEEFIDPTTGKFRDFSPEEKASLREMFFRMLYKEMDGYWATRIGKNINVFGERDTQWYNNVYSTFVNMSKVRSNRKLMSLLIKYKTETRSEFDDLKNRFKSQELSKRKDEIVRRYEELGLSAARSPEIKTLTTRIAALERQEKQIDAIFSEMAQAVQSSVHEGVQKAISEKIKTDKPPVKTDMGEKTEKQVEEVSAKLQKAAVPDNIDKELAETSELLEKLEGQIKAQEESTQKDASYKESPHFDPKILYGPVLQKKMSEILAVEAKFPGIAVTEEAVK